MEGKEVYSITDIMKIFSIGRNTAYQYLRDKIIPCRKIRNKYIIPKKGVDNFINKIACIDGATNDIINIIKT